MNIGIIGLGRMGMSIADRLVKAGHQVWGFDLNIEMQEESKSLGVTIVPDLATMAKQVHIFWLMIPQGKPVDNVIDHLRSYIKDGDIIIDGGNSFYQDSQRRAKDLATNNIQFIDCGVSGGLQGHFSGFCLMIGGDKKTYEFLIPVFAAIAAPQGYAYIGISGAGHYVKMVHNGIEYGLLQAYAEGFQIIKEGSFKDQAIDLHQLTDLWNHGSIIRSWILQLAHEVFAHDKVFESITGCIDQGGTGAWTVAEAQKYQLPVPILKSALEIRAWSCKTGGNYATKVVALLRNKFGGHLVHKKGDS